MSNEEKKHAVPPGVQADIDAVLEDLQLEIENAERVDPNYNRIMETLENISNQLAEEEAEGPQGYVFDLDEFKDALPHIVADQQSALKKEKLTPQEFVKRFNRWTAFCDAVLNLGISCVHDKDALSKKDFEKAFSTLQLNDRFRTTFLKPHGIRIEFAYKSRSMKEHYKWLAMPVLIVTNEQGKEEKIAITASPHARVWWLDILIGFHSSYEWSKEALIDQEDFDQAPYPGLGLEQKWLH